MLVIDTSFILVAKSDTNTHPNHVVSGVYWQQNMGVGDSLSMVFELKIITLYKAIRVNIFRHAADK